MRLAALPFLAGTLFAQPYDILITGGRVLDGTGNPWFVADVGIRGDTIAAIGRLAGAEGRIRLDATGHVVAPGFIDTHSHGRGNTGISAVPRGFGGGILGVPGAENLIRQGVTTIIEGPDGGSPIPLGPFLDQVKAAKIAVNFGSLAGHGSILERVMGRVNRHATDAELARMKDLARQAMLDGAMGLSTGLFYVPGNFAPTEEVIALAKIVAPMGGLHTSHMRDEAAAILDSVRETIRIGEEGGLPTQVTHHKISGKPYWGKSVETLKLVDEARARGVDVTIDQYPYTASSTGTAALFPQWSLEGGQKSLVERLGAPDTRRRIAESIVQNIMDNRGGGDPKNVVIANCEHDRSLAGKSLAELTAARGVPVTLETAAETAMAIQAKGGCSAIYHSMSEEDLERILRYPFTMVASDGGIPVFGEGVPHPRNYGTFARILGRYVRERKVLTLEDAIRKMSSFPAARFRLHDRGLIREGLKADIVVFNADTIVDKAEFGKPHQYAAGVKHVVVNGKTVLRDGAMTAERPGRVLYGPSHQK